MNTSELPCILLHFCTNICVNGLLKIWNCIRTYGGLTSKGRNYAQSHSITHISPRTTEAFVGQMLNYGEGEKKKKSRVVLKNGKIKIPVQSGWFDIPSWSVWVLQGHEGGGTGSEQLLMASRGSINSNKQFPPAVTNPAQPQLRIKVLLFSQCRS